MPHDSWDSDPDLMALTGRPRKRLALRRIAPHLALVAGLTFVAAYYLPMHRAHRELTRQHALAAEREQKLGSEFEQVRRELDKTQQERKALAEQSAEVAQRHEARARRLESLQQQIEGALSKPLKTGSMRLERLEDGVRLSLDAEQIFLPQKFDVSPKGKDLLCDVARAAGEGPVRVVAAPGAGESPPAALRAALRNPWSLGAARAASVVEVLAKSCRISAGRLVATGAPAAADRKQASLHIELPLSGEE